MVPFCVLVLIAVESGWPDICVGTVFIQPCSNEIYAISLRVYDAGYGRAWTICDGWQLGDKPLIFFFWPARYLVSAMAYAFHISYNSNMDFSGAATDELGQSLI